METKKKHKVVRIYNHNYYKDQKTVVELSQTEYVSRLRDALSDYFGSGSYHNFVGMGDFARGIAWEYMTTGNRVKNAKEFRKNKEQAIDSLVTEKVKEIAKLRNDDFDKEFNKRYVVKKFLWIKILIGKKA